MVNSTKIGMLKIISVLVITLCLSNFSHAQPSLTKDEQAVQQTIIDFFDAASNRDSIGLMNSAAPDIMLFEYGQQWNMDTLVQKMIIRNTSSDFKRVNKFDFIKTLVDKNMAWVSYHLQSEITREGKQATIRWVETVVLLKTKKKWKIKLLHSTMTSRS